MRIWKAGRDVDLENSLIGGDVYKRQVTSIELAPEGTGYRAKSRFARFYNIPELMNMFKEIADIKTCLLYTSRRDSESRDER